MIVEVCLRPLWFPTFGKSVPDYGLCGTINIFTTGTKVKTGIGKISVTNLKNGTFFGRVGAITKNKIEKKYFYFFFNFRKFGSVGSVKRKIKKLWP